MINWTNVAPPEPRGPALPIRRTPAYKALIATCTSKDLIGCYTHFYKGKTMPCQGRGAFDKSRHEDEAPCDGNGCARCKAQIPFLYETTDCDACDHGIPYRWHAYLSAVDHHDGLHFIFECTAQASEPFTLHRDANGSLRGCIFEARRLNNRPNGRILIRTKNADLTDKRIPHGPDLTQCLAILWSLPTDHVTAERIDPERSTPTATVRPPNSEPETPTGD